MEISSLSISVGFPIFHRKVMEEVILPKNSFLAFMYEGRIICLINFLGVHEDDEVMAELVIEDETLIGSVYQRNTQTGNDRMIQADDMVTMSKSTRCPNIIIVPSGWEKSDGVELYLSYASTRSPNIKLGIYGSVRKEDGVTNHYYNCHFD